MCNGLLHWLCEEKYGKKINFNIMELWDQLILAKQVSGQGTVKRTSKNINKIVKQRAEWLCFSNVVLLPAAFNILIILNKPCLFLFCLFQFDIRMPIPPSHYRRLMEKLDPPPAHPSVTPLNSLTLSDLHQFSEHGPEPGTGKYKTLCNSFQPSSFIRPSHQLITTSDCLFLPLTVITIPSEFH